jgi:hypothetical protein
MGGLSVVLDLTDYFSTGCKVPAQYFSVEAKRCVQGLFLSSIEWEQAGFERGRLS